MQKDNPAYYECPKSKDALHLWYLLNDGLRAKCRHCKLVLDKDQTLDVYERHYLNVLCLLLKTLHIEKEN